MTTPQSRHKMFIDFFTNVCLVEVLHNYMYDRDYYPVVCSGPPPVLTTCNEKRNALLRSNLVVDRNLLDIKFVCTRNQSRPFVKRRCAHFIDELIQSVKKHTFTRRFGFKFVKMRAPGTQHHYIYAISKASHPRLVFTCSTTYSPLGKSPVYITQNGLPYPTCIWNHQHTLKELKSIMTTTAKNNVVKDHMSYVLCRLMRLEMLLKDAQYADDKFQELKQLLQTYNRLKRYLSAQTHFPEQEVQLLLTSLLRKNY